MIYTYAPSEASSSILKFIGKKRELEGLKQNLRDGGGREDLPLEGLTGGLARLSPFVICYQDEILPKQGSRSAPVRRRNHRGKFYGPSNAGVRQAAPPGFTVHQSTNPS